MFYYFLWNGKGDKMKDKSYDQWIWVWRPKDDCIDLCSFSNRLLKQHEWNLKCLDTTNNLTEKFYFLLSAVIFVVVYQ